MTENKILDSQSDGKKYLTNPRKVNNEYDLLRKKEYFNKYTLKRPLSIACIVYMQLKNTTNWENGQTSKDLQAFVKLQINNNKKLKGKRLKPITMASIYNAISDLNMYCDHIYIVNTFNYRKICPACRDNFHYEPFELVCLKCKGGLRRIKEFRYFCPYEGEDRDKEKRKLWAQTLRTKTKREGLESFEEKELRHQE